MGCHRFGNKSGAVRGIVCMPNIYEYKGYLFEWHDYLGPVYLKKDSEPAQRIKKGFWDIATEFRNLTKEERKQYLVCG